MHAIFIWSWGQRFQETPCDFAYSSTDNHQAPVMESRMYQLIRQAKPIVDRQFEIEFLDPGTGPFVYLRLTA